MSVEIIKLFLLEYAIGFIADVWERNMTMAYYWGGAFLLNYAVLKGALK
jgi:hypothetical protein